MVEKRGVFSTEVESEIEASKVHWSEVDPAMSEPEHLGKSNREYFEVLKRRKYVREGDRLVAMQCINDEELPRRSLFLKEGDGLVVGEKLAEGGQADIYAATGFVKDVVVKVFKEGSVLEDIEKQWPPALLKYHEYDARNDPEWKFLPSIIRGATLLRDERLDRFAFVMLRFWGDLRKLIDHQMIQSHNQGPPLSPDQVLRIMWRIASNMNMLHEQHPPILHKDLKAANVLVLEDPVNAFVGGCAVNVLRKKYPTKGEPYLDRHGMYEVQVVDFECSIGVVGTGFWRAPEILQQLKDKVPVSELVCIEKCDVYSYGMTCYEFVSGHIPFEDYQDQPKDGCDLVFVAM